LLEGPLFLLTASPDQQPFRFRIWDNWRVTGQDQDPWEEFDKLGPAAPDRVPGHPGGEPMGFGFRTGVRSARVAVGFAIYTLALGTVLVLAGCIAFAARGQWLLVGLMLAIEAVFIFAFNRLVAQARNRSGRRRRRGHGFPEKTA
jgi:hypothetical protein